MLWNPYLYEKWLWDILSAIGKDLCIYTRSDLYIIYLGLQTCRNNCLKKIYAWREGRAELSACGQNSLWTTGNIEIFLFGKMISGGIAHDSDGNTRDSGVNGRNDSFQNTTTIFLPKWVRAESRASGGKFTFGHLSCLNGFGQVFLPSRGSRYTIYSSLAL